MPQTGVAPTRAAMYDSDSLWKPFPHKPALGVIPPSGRSSAWLERYVRDVEVARSNRVAPTDNTIGSPMGAFM